MRKNKIFFRNSIKSFALIEKPSEINIQELCKKISNVLKSKKKRRLFEQYLKNRENLNTVYNNLQGIEQDAFTYSKTLTSLIFRIS